MKDGLKFIFIFIIIHCFLLTQASAADSTYPENTDPKSHVVIKVAGWGVYNAPERADKMIGYQSFEKKYGASIEFHPLNNLDDIIAAAESSEYYDVFIISNEGIRLLHDMDLIAPLNLSRLPNYQNLHHNLQYSEWSQFHSRVYAMPWAWGPTGLMYDQDIISHPDSWNILWDKNYRGRIAMWDDMSMIWTTALALGYKNVYSLTRTQLAQVKNKLFEFNRLAGIYYKGGNDELALASQGKLVAYNSWYNPSERLRTAGKNFKMIIPKEGAVGMFDSYVVSKKSQQKALVHQFINHQLNPDVQLEMINVTGLSPANILTLRLLNKEKMKELHLDEVDYFNRMLLWDHMPRKNLYEKVLEEIRNDWQQRQAGS